MARPFYTLRPGDVGHAIVSAFGKSWDLSSLMGGVMPGDVGKRVYCVAPDLLQVENTEQRDARVAKEVIEASYANSIREKIGASGDRHLITLISILSNAEIWRLRQLIRDTEEG